MKEAPWSWGRDGDDDSGSSSGSAYVFVGPSTGWATATETAKLKASDGAGGDQFGASVSVEEDTVVVGAYADDDNGDAAGSAYAFAVGGWTRIGGSGAGTAGHTVEELDGWIGHTFGIRALNGGGPGPASCSVTATPSANRAPEFATATTARSVAENTAAVENIGEPVTAADLDSGDTLAYSLSGVDASPFSIDAATGQITVGTGASLDYETKASYTFTVSVSDGKDSAGNADTAVDDTITVTINVTDDDTEAPGMPEAPTVSALSSTSLSVAWSEPANSGPAITDYDVQYRAGSAGDFTRWTHDGVATATTITGLAPSTEYEVQVRAISGEGMGAWSSSGTATTLAPSASLGVPIFSPSTVSADEGSTATYQVALSVQPSGNVTLTLESSDTGALEVSPRSLTFTTSDWDVRQTVTVRGVEDSGTADETVTVTHTATGGGYDTASGILTVTVDDDDTASSGGSSGGSSGSGGGGAGGSDRADISGASPYSGARYRGPTHQGRLPCLLRSSRPRPRLSLKTGSRFGSSF